MRESYFDGGIVEFAFIAVSNALLSILTLGIFAPWAVVRVYRWEIEHTVVDGHRLGFDGSGWGLFTKWVVWALLTLLTFGIYGFWMHINVNKWKAEHTYFLN